MDELSDRDHDLLAALATGETLNDYARRHNYSLAWGQWRSREIRKRLGVGTLREAVAMADDDGQGVTRSDFDKLTGLVSKLGDAIEDLAKAPRNEQPAAQATVQARELDVKDHAKALGLSLEDVEKLKGEKEYERFRTMQERLERERAEEEGEDEGEGENGGRNLGERVLDGLGGIRNVKPQ